MTGDPIDISSNVLVVKSCPTFEVIKFVLGNLLSSDYLYPPGADSV